MVGWVRVRWWNLYKMNFMLYGLCIQFLYIMSSMRLSKFSSGFCDEVCLMIGEDIYAQMLNRADAIKMDNIMYL